MKICILNNSGNVGKSTITREVIFPRLDNGLAVEIESINSSNADYNIETIKYSGNEDFANLYEHIVDERDTCFDIGASEIGNFFNNAEEYEGAIHLFDVFVIPTISDIKIMEDTAKTIRFLRLMEIPDEKIKVVFNRIDKDVKSEFSALLNFDFDFDTNLFIKKSNFFKDLSLLRTTFFDIYNADTKFYRTQMLKESDPKVKKILLKKDLLNMGASKKIKELDNLFAGISGFENNLFSKLENKKTEVKEVVAKKSTTKSESAKVEKVTEATENTISEDDEEL